MPQRLGFRVISNRIKQLAKRLLPPRWVSWLRERNAGVAREVQLLRGYQRDWQRYARWSGSSRRDDQIVRIAKILRQYHIIEKGLTMPECRLGFGKDILLSLCGDCLDFTSKYGHGDAQVLHAIGVVLEYREFHALHAHRLDREVLAAIERLAAQAPAAQPTAQRDTSIEEYFRHAQGDFRAFSQSRSSIRSFTGENLPLQTVLEALELARNAPSACNRQSWRTHVYTERDQLYAILQVQGGNRGFGHRTSKLIVITGEVGVFDEPAERNQAYIDGGIYAMNVLYALHYFRVGACILNCSFTPEREEQVRALCGATPSEVFIAMIACGVPSAKFRIAASLRTPLHLTNRIVGS